MMRVYLAGPDVFLPEPERRGAELKAVLAGFGLAGVFPLDPPPRSAPPPLLQSEGSRIAAANEAHIASCQALIANLTPFRGPSADAGTVFELGFARARGLLLWGWTNVATPFATRSRAWAGGGMRDREGMAIEECFPGDNLMIEGAILASGGSIEVENVTPARRWTDLAALRRAAEGLSRRG
ncbi:MAG: nucleoside 2-deoxyribosyltransferase [Rhodospirillales bacterium]|nr:nucleoside 2-deoxyribosyltransferase [Rhodospirillales bacterium]